MKWLDIEQNTDEWFAVRAGRLGGSSVKHVMANYGKAFGDPAHRLALKLAIEQETNQYITDTYFNKHMLRGQEEEPIARKLYEDTTFSEVYNGGYYIYADDMGCSPDGNVYKDGLIEIKSRMYHIHAANIRRGKYDPSDKWQLVYDLLCSNRDWIDYNSFCLSYPKKTKLFIDRVRAVDVSNEISMVKTRVDEFRKLIDEKRKLIK